jgi:hypothetical protein
MAGLRKELFVVALAAALIGARTGSAAAAEGRSGGPDAGAERPPIAIDVASVAWKVYLGLKRWTMAKGPHVALDLVADADSLVVHYVHLVNLIGNAGGRRAPSLLRQSHRQRPLDEAEVSEAARTVAFRSRARATRLEWRLAPSWPALAVSRPSCALLWRVHRSA